MTPQVSSERTTSARVELLADQEVWRRLESLVRRSRRGRVMAAVAYYSRDLLQMREGDLLVVNMERGTVAAGATDPRVLLELVKRGVEVRAHPALHAKIVVAAGAAVVGSANASTSSREHLAEVAAVIRGRDAVTAARKEVERLASIATEVTVEHLRVAITWYRPPRPGQPGTAERAHPLVLPQSSQMMWTIPLELTDWPDAVADAHQRHQRGVRRAAGSRREVRVDTFMLPESEDPGIGEDDVVLQLMGDADPLVWPPARILRIVPVARRGRGQPHRLFYVATRVGLAPLPLADVRAAVNSNGGRLSTDGARRLRSEDARAAVLALWSIRDS